MTLTLLPVVASGLLPYPFDRQYMQLALVAGLAVGIAAPLVGTFLVERKMSLIGDGVGHIAFAGVSAGLFAGVWPIWTALIAAVLGAILLDLIRASGRASNDLALAVVFYSGISGGIVLAGASGSYNAGVLSYLFGSILTVDGNEVRAVVLMSALIVGLVSWLWRTLLATVTDPEFSRTLGLSVRAIDLCLAIATALLIVGAMRVVGVLLVAALMVLPVGAARVLAPSFRSTLIASSALGAMSVVIGLWVARAQALPPGGTIVLTAVGFVIVSAMARAAVSRIRSQRAASVADAAA